MPPVNYSMASTKKHYRLLILTDNGFSQIKDPGKWEKAVSALKDFMTFAEDENNYELLENEENPSQALYDLFQTYNREIIWATAANTWGGMDGDAFDRRCTPRSEQNGMGCTGCHSRIGRCILL